ncbi:MAG: hypothetical protein VXX43_03990, partial [Pseudomonadota bacterium]|nr:hypothetical protein [Pseudomonadota bacterium]
MSIYDSDRRYRRQMAGRLTRSVVYLLILGGVGLVSYQLGVEDLEAQKRQHEQVLDEINGRLAEMDQRVADQALQVRQALEKARVTEQRYAADMPRGTDRELYDLIRARIADGLSVARLRFLIGSARRKRDCLDPDTRRFVVRTPVTSGPRSAASFGKDRITITGRGASAKSADGRALRVTAAPKHYLNYDLEGRKDAWQSDWGPSRNDFNAIVPKQEQVEYYLAQFHRMVTVS